LELASLTAWQCIAFMSGAWLAMCAKGNRNSHSCCLHSAGSKTADMPCRHCTLHRTTKTSSHNCDGARNGLCSRALMVSRYMGYWVWVQSWVVVVHTVWLCCMTAQRSRCVQSFVQSWSSMPRSFIDCKLYSILTTASRGPSAIAQLFVVKYCLLFGGFLALF